MTTNCALMSKKIKVFNYVSQKAHIMKVLDVERNENG